MGCVNNPSSERHMHHPHIYKYLQIMKLDHPLNVNMKYQHICKITSNTFVGQGYKKTSAYECLTTEEDFRQKRKEFWETRTSGSRELWGVIEGCVRAEDQAVIEGQLDKHSMMALNNSLQMCVDGNFVKYDVPVFCINMPSKFSDKTPAVKNLKEDFEEETLNIKIRCQKFPVDTLMTISNTIPIKDLKRQYLQLVSLDSNEHWPRFFYKGAQMLQGFKVGSYDLREGYVIQAMLTKPTPTSPQHQ